MTEPEREAQYGQPAEAREKDLPAPQQWSGAAPGQWPGAYPPPYPQPAVVVSAKSAGIAVLLSFLWLGAGHLYAGNIGTGVALLAYHGFLVLLAITLVGSLLAIPLWLLSAPVVMFLAARAAQGFNARNGVVVR